MSVTHFMGGGQIYLLKHFIGLTTTLPSLTVNVIKCRKQLTRSVKCAYLLNGVFCFCLVVENVTMACACLSGLTVNCTLLSVKNLQCMSFIGMEWFFKGKGENPQMVQGTNNPQSYLVKTTRTLINSPLRSFSHPTVQHVVP